MTDARGKVWIYTYEQYGLLEKLVDPLNHTVFRNVYGSDGRVIEQYDGLDHKTSFAWNIATQTQTATDARGNAWKDVYSNGLLVQRIDPLNNTTTYAYGADLNLTSVTDPRGKQTNRADTAVLPAGLHLQLVQRRADCAGRSRQHRELRLRWRRQPHRDHETRQQRHAVRP